MEHSGASSRSSVPCLRLQRTATTRQAQPLPSADGLVQRLHPSAARRPSGGPRQTSPQRSKVTPHGDRPVPASTYQGIVLRVHPASAEPRARPEFSRAQKFHPDFPGFRTDFRRFVENFALEDLKVPGPLPCRGETPRQCTRQECLGQGREPGPNQVEHRRYVA